MTSNAPPPTPRAERYPRAALRTADADALDRTLLAAVAQGDQAAFKEMHLRYHLRVASFIRSRIRRNDLADEITNDTLWAVWQFSGRFKGYSKVSTWIMGIAHNLSMARLRRLDRLDLQQSGARISVDFGTTVHDPWSEADDREWVDAALVHLPAEQRAVLEMAYRLGYSCKEISASENCPVNTVKTRLYHGRRKLTELLPRLASMRI